MPNLEGLKEKLAQAKTGLNEKIDKIAFIQKWKEKRAAAQPAPASPYSLGHIYKTGGIITRLQVIFVYLLFIGAIAATFQASRKMLARMGAGAEHEKLKEDYSKGFAEVAQKVVENANLISLGKFTSRISPSSGRNMMAVDVWIRVSDPQTADFVQKNEAVFQDRITEGLAEAFQQEVDPLSQAGKEKAKAILLNSLNQALSSGKVEDLYFQNLIAQ